MLFAARKPELPQSSPGQSEGEYIMTIDVVAEISFADYVVMQAAADVPAVVETNVRNCSQTHLTEQGVLVIFE